MLKKLLLTALLSTSFAFAAGGMACPKCDMNKSGMACDMNGTKCKLGKNCPCGAECKCGDNCKCKPMKKAKKMKKACDGNMSGQGKMMGGMACPKCDMNKTK